MLPQTAQHSRQIPQQYSNHGLPGSPLDPASTSRHPNRAEPLPFRSARSYGASSNLAPQYRAVPVDHRGPGMMSASAGGQYYDPSEHLLRRKTPNGTLAAGYDGTPVSWSSRVPALKHVVLPISGSPSTNRYDRTAAYDGSRFRWRNENMDRNMQPFSKRMDAIDGGDMQITGPGHWLQLPSISDPPQNVWDQIRAYPASSYYSYNDNQIPTVLQPYQPPLGPTASNVEGHYYGPYWPDGRFIPYRPAAVGHHGYQERMHGSNPMFEPDPLPSADQMSLSHNPSFVDAINVGLQNGHDPLSLESIGSRIPSDSLDFSYHYLDGQSRFYDTSDGSRTPTAQSFQKTNNPHFREKTLSWAHAIYVDLLSYLRQVNKEKESSEFRNGRSFRSTKTNIYPKPPRQPAYLSPATWEESSMDGQENFDAKRRIKHPIIPADSSLTESKLSSWPGPDNHIDIKYDRPTKTEVDIELRRPQYLSPFGPPQMPSPSPRDRGRQALNVLTSLCDQSGWSWIDAMLLAGCLAYGLEDYTGAIEWYSKILLMDPLHVEAMANSAAAFKSLNRLQEAESYWLEAIELRPTYFEAVEHLIGLLCETHRGKEAIKIIEFVESKLRMRKWEENSDRSSETSNSTDQNSVESTGVLSDRMVSDYDLLDSDRSYTYSSIRNSEDYSTAGFGSSGLAVPGSQNGRVLALLHAKGNMLYSLGEVEAASRAFEDAIMISTGREFRGVQDLIERIVEVLSFDPIGPLRTNFRTPLPPANKAPLLLPPDHALQTASRLFSRNGELPGLQFVAEGSARQYAMSTTSNCLLSLAKIFQDSMSNTNPRQKISRAPTGVGDILALYYLSLALNPSPSTANNVGILLASVQQSPTAARRFVQRSSLEVPQLPGVVPGSGIALALAYYNYGLNLDPTHAHIYTNLGSLLKDIGQLGAAVSMYEKAVKLTPSFDIALANLANAVKDQGHTSDAIVYYKRAVAASPDFAEAVCGLANALNSVCDWTGRGGVVLDGGRQDRWHVDDNGMIARAGNAGGGWMKRVVDIVNKQLEEGSAWGRGTIQVDALGFIIGQLEAADSDTRWSPEKRNWMGTALSRWAGQQWEGARLVRLLERATKRATRRWYLDRYVKNRQLPASSYPRPQFPSGLTIPSAPTVLPFHTFTCPLSAKDIRMISQRNGLRISSSTLRAPWLQGSVFPPPAPPSPHLKIGYVSSDFNNHPLAHLMQSVFGFHDPSRAQAYCYATTASDNSIHRKQIELESPVFRDVNGWAVDRLVHQIVEDGIHILVNLNGYTRGARNEVFAARPAPIQMSFMGFAGTLGAEWCDYLLADETTIPHDTLRPWRSNLELEDLLGDRQAQEEENWVYSENIIFCRHTFFCCDHAQSDSKENTMSWDEEQRKRWVMRKELFPNISDDTIILGNFNQLYKIEPTTFRTWLRILDRVPKAILWLLRFPDLGETNLKRTAREWAGEEVASRICFTDVAPKHLHISRARVCDLFLDTPECNAHTTAADVLWSSTPLLTLPRYKYKMCSRMAASILKGALPDNKEGRQAASELIATDDEQYEEFAIRLANSLSYDVSTHDWGLGSGRLHGLRKLLYDSRWTCALFDTKRWVADLEDAYDEAWRRWVVGESGDIYL